jgi:putative ABC transport system permease protein
LPRLALKSLWARKTRALSTTFAVFIGVALVAGAYILTDTINKAFGEIFSESLKGTDVVVTSKDIVKQESGETPDFPQAVLPRVEKVPGVRLAAGAIFTPGGFFDRQNKSIGAKFAPKFIASVLPGPLESLTYVDGGPPKTPRQTTIDKAAADAAGLSIGDPLKIAGRHKAKTYRLVGLTELGSASFGGASIAQLTLLEAQRVTGKVGRLDQISVAASSGVTPTELRNRIEKVVPPTVRVETGQQNATRQTNDIKKNLKFLTIALLVFAGVALFVGAFLIFNTFSITIAQRVREFGMLRTLGASRRQILGSVITESVAIGVIGSLAGLAGGILFAKGINALFNAAGFGLPTTAQVIATRTVVVSLLVGVLVTLVSSLAPAIRSTRVPPMAALRELPPPRSRRRTVLYGVLAGLLSAAGVALVLYGLFGGLSGGNGAKLLGIGAVLVILGVSIFSSRLVRPLANLSGWPLERLRGLVGRLARENTQRKPARTAATAAALMIGLALVSFVTIFAAGFKGSIANAIDRNFRGEIELQNTDGFSPIPNGAARLAGKVPGVAAVSSLRTVQAKSIGIGTEKITGLDPRTAPQLLSLDWEQGSQGTLGRLRDDQAIVDKNYADGAGVGVGDTLRLLGQTGRRSAYRIVGVVKDNANLLGSAVITQRAMARNLDQTDDTYVFVKLAPGADATQVQAVLKAGAARLFPTVDVLNQQELKDNQEQQVNTLLNLIYALLSLAVITSLFGIANTLALSIHERTRELGMLRAIGMSRRQVRELVRYEAVITALIGAVLGLILGVIFAALISRPLADEGFTLSYPVPTLVLLMVLAGLAGVLAAIAPARRASRLDVLEALAYE